jgi:transposase
MVAVPVHAHPSKRDAKSYLASFCWDGDPFCPRCSESTVYNLKDGRMRCGGCGYTFHDFSRRWINRVQIPPRYWLKILDMYARGFNAREISDDLMVSYNTVFKALNVVRLAVVCLAADAGKFLDDNHGFVDFCAAHKRALKDGRTISCRAPVFGIRHKKDEVELELIDELRGQEAFDLPALKKLWREIIYTDAWEGYDGLVFSCCKRFRDDTPIPPIEAKLGLDAAEGFWAFARKNLSVYHCLSPENFPYYLKEQEFRYRHRDGDLISALLGALCRFVPNLAH